MDYIIREFQSCSEMLSFYSSKRESCFLELESQSPKKFYGIDLLESEQSIYFCSDGLCELQISEAHGLIAFLVDDYFVFINPAKNFKKTIRLNAPGDSLFHRNERFVAIYETGVFIFSPDKEIGECKETDDLIYDWNFLSDSVIHCKLCDGSEYNIDLRTIFCDSKT